MESLEGATNFSREETCSRLVHASQVKKENFQGQDQHLLRKLQSHSHTQQSCFKRKCIFQDTKVGVVAMSPKQYPRLIY